MPEVPQDPPSAGPPLGGDRLEGTVERVTFHNEENGYCVLRVMVPGAHEPLTITGNIPRITAGEHLEAEGSWVVIPQYGRQFKAEKMRAAAPQSAAGIERYLASGLIDGIGPKYAERIVAKFGTDTLEVIEKQSKRLEEVDGIATKRRKEIKGSWNEQRTIHGIMVFLHEHGIPTGKAVRVFQKYGEEALEVLREDPYRLAREMTGIGFLSADQIARNLGLAEDSPERLRAGVLHALDEASGSGHTACPREKLVAAASELLRSGDEGAVIRAVEDLRMAGDVVEEEVDGRLLVYLAKLQRSEVMVAEQIKALASRPCGHPAIDLEKALAWTEEKTGKVLAPGQRAAVAMSVSRRLLVITGGPGVGKTTVLQSILMILRAKRVEAVLAAPTGRAAKRLAEAAGGEAHTLHRLLEYQPSSGFGRHAGRRLEGELFVVDEASMIDINLMRSLLEAIPVEGHLILVGDADQLPSVGPGSVLRDLVGSGAVPVAELTEIYRQASESAIVRAAHDTNAGQVPVVPEGADGDFFFFERETPEEVSATLTDLVARRMPLKFGLSAKRDIQVLTPMNRGPLGTKMLNEHLQHALNPAGEIDWSVERFGTTYRPGDKVIQLRNNYDKGVFNGDIGHIRSVETDPTQVRVDFDGLPDPVNYEPAQLDELGLAYAITIHKSQGSEFPAVVIPVTTQHFVMLQRNLIYTAITRGKRLVILIGSKKALEIAVGNTSGSERCGALRWRLEK